MDVRRLSVPEWDDALPAEGFEVFHDPDALSVLADHAPGELRLYGGFKGDRPVGLFPAFVREVGVGRVVTSPPPSMAVPRLGPLVMPASPKRRKREKVNRQFVDAVLADLGLDGSLSSCRIRCPLSYGDPRPFTWSDLDLRPAFTYVVSAEESPAAVRESFSEGLRRELRTPDLDVSVEVGGAEAAHTVYEDLRARYEGRDEDLGPSWPYVRDLVSALDERARVYVARSPEGSYLSGVVVLYSNDAAYYWLGGTSATYENATANSLVHWAVLRDLFEDPPVESVDRYDLVGANTERLCRSKAKFGGELERYYVAETGGLRVDLARRAYSLVRG